MLTITVDDTAFRQHIARLQQRLGDLTPVLAGIGQELETRIHNRFEIRSDPEGQPWAPWAESTLATYPEDGNRRLLDRYGDMRGHLNWDADATSVRVGFVEPYATYHEFGTKKMPRRGLLFANPETGQLAPDDERAVLEILEDLLDLA